MSIIISCLMVLFNSAMSLLVFCMLGLSVTGRGMLRSPASIVDSSRFMYFFFISFFSFGLFRPFMFKVIVYMVTLISATIFATLFYFFYSLSLFFSFFLSFTLFLPFMVLIILHDSICSPLLTYNLYILTF